MRRMTYRPRLRDSTELAEVQRLRRGENGFVFVAAICMGLMVPSARGGSLDSLAPPTSLNSAMWTLENIYNVLDTRTTNVTKRTGGFTEPTGGPTNGTMHTLDNIMTLVTNRAPVPKTGPTISYAPGDAGWYSTNVGVAWPNPRFTIGTGTDGTNCVTDNLTGLIWARNANIATNGNWCFTQYSSVNGTCTWAQAFDVITNSAGPVNGALGGPNGYGGTNDWRLPNCKELFSLIDSRWYNPALCNTAGTAQWTVQGEPFTGVKLGFYWSSTAYFGSTTTAMAAAPGGSSAIVYYATMTIMYSYVWPVRGGR